MEVNDLLKKIKLDLLKLVQVSKIYEEAWQELDKLDVNSIDQNALDAILSPSYRHLLAVEREGQMTTDETALLVDIDNLDDMLVRGK